MYVKPMLPTLSAQIPEGEKWSYEIKYDGFRAMLSISEEETTLISRNGKDLGPLFPEIIDAVQSIFDRLQKFMPCTFDGELVSLKNPYKASFEAIQQRGRMRAKDKISEAAGTNPCQYLIFDILECKHEKTAISDYLSRKEQLKSIASACGFPLEPIKNNQLIQYVPSFSRTLWSTIRAFDSEGMIAKEHKSKWEAGVRTKSWLKIKNYKYALFFIIGYDKKNGYFKAGVYKGENVIDAGVFSHGLEGTDRDSLIKILRENKDSEDSQWITISPAICVELQFLELYKNQLREPSFSAFRFDQHPEECTWEQLKLNAVSFHEEVQITHPDKPLWDKPLRTKTDYLAYLAEVSDYMLPFLKNKLLTVIRYPHGTSDEAFYQKNCPDYAPKFVATAEHDGIDYILCNDISTLIWLGNQLALEFHIPFQTYDSSRPNEIVFDLDPPSRDDFHLAVSAASEMRKLFDSFGLASFPKLSGGKGIQIHIPMTKNRFSYDQTKKFTSFIAEYLVNAFPELYTTERLKKNRGNRLYVDYIQHAEGKTIIAPYSVRGNPGGAFVAAPLYWDEVTEDLRVNAFTMEAAAERVKNGCPFQDYFTSPQDEVIEQVLDFIAKNKSQQTL
ncbi:DNA ligase D [Metabacillus idriensis]|uniref:DNA ligase D n=1 Tax=Metabacillus idriensis TaxID=324768 RepID=UPI002813E4F4|nr:DNA ligase D [Metabacillus idriensis]MDR0136931.1 DNA ligase D [Metabacillus idriensis]